MPNGQDWIDYLESIRESDSEITDLAFRQDESGAGGIYVNIDHEVIITPDGQVEGDYTEIAIIDLEDWDRFFAYVDEYDLPEPELWYH